MGPFTALRSKSPCEVRAAIALFSPEYGEDWRRWLRCRAVERPRQMGIILRRWQATRPKPMRRVKVEADHEPPYLESLYRDGVKSLRLLGDLDVRSFHARSSMQTSALRGLWSTFESLAVGGQATIVGISKAVLLISDGRIGPAFDSSVRGQLGVKSIKTCDEWIASLEAVADDIDGFERSCRTLRAIVPLAHRNLAYGRLYDMAFGPR